MRSYEEEEEESVHIVEFKKRRKNGNFFGEDKNETKEENINLK